MAFFGDIHFVRHRVEHQRRNEVPLALQSDRNRELRNAVHEIRRAVDRIDNETVRLVFALYGAAFFHQEAIARPRARQLLDQHAFGARIRGGHEIRRTLLGDLQILQLAEIADQRAPRFAGGRDHHIQGRRQIRHRLTRGRLIYSARLT